MLVTTAQKVTVVVPVLPPVRGVSNMLVAPVRAVLVATMVAPQEGLREQILGGIAGAVEVVVAEVETMMPVMGIGGAMGVLVAATLVAAAAVGVGIIHECSIVFYLIRKNTCDILSEATCLSVGLVFGGA